MNDGSKLLRETLEKIPGYFRRNDLPCYLATETFSQLSTRFDNDNEELIYCYLLWVREAESRCIGSVRERHMVQHVVENRVSHTDLGFAFDEELYIPKVYTVKDRLDLESGWGESEIDEIEKSRIILAGDDYSEILNFCNDIFRNLTMFLIRHAASKGMILNRIWDFYLSTVDSVAPEYPMEDDTVYAVGACCYFSKESSFNEAVKENIKQCFRQAIAEIEAIAISINPSLSYVHSLDIWGDNNSAIEIDDTFGKGQIIQFTGLSARSVLNYEIQLLDYQEEAGVPEKDRFHRAKAGQRNHRYKKQEVLDLLYFIRDTVKDDEIVDQCEKSIGQIQK